MVGGAAAVAIALLATAAAVPFEKVAVPSTASAAGAYCWDSGWIEVMPQNGACDEYCKTWS